MSDKNNFGSISAEDNILHAIALIDRSMSEMVSLEDGNLQDKFVAMRLQIDNLQAKCEHLLPDKEQFDEYNKEKDKFESFDNEEIPDFYKKIQQAKSQFLEDSRSQKSSLQTTRQYFSRTLEAIYSLLAKKGVYQAVGEKSVEDGIVDPSDND